MLPNKLNIRISGVKRDKVKDRPGLCEKSHFFRLERVLVHVRRGLASVKSAPVLVKQRPSSCEKSHGTCGKRRTTREKSPVHAKRGLGRSG